MSGVKYSKITLFAEMLARRKVIYKINVLTKNIKKIKENIKFLLTEIPEGVKDSFLDEVKWVKVWEAKRIPSSFKGMNSTELEESLKRLEQMNAEGSKSFDTLIEIKEVRRDEKSRKLIGWLERLKIESKGVEDLLKKWRAKDYEELTETFNGIFSKIEDGEFIEVESNLNQSEMNLNRLMEEVGSLESQDEQRNYILSALRETCKEMGWEDVKEPELEDKTDPSSHLIYMVNTYTSGINVFSLALDGIRVESEITNENKVCYKQFNDFSDKLKKFGIKTKFEHETLDDPNLRGGEELNLPDAGIEGQIEKD